jgi:hypothetical protein
MTPIALLILLFGQGPIYRPARVSFESPMHRGGREARWNASTGRWQLFDGDRCVGEIQSRGVTEAWVDDRYVPLNPIEIISGG